MKAIRQKTLGKRKQAMADGHLNMNKTNRKEV